MSLINDALKRASETQPPPLPKSEAAPRMELAEHKRPSAWPLVVVPLLLVFILAVAGWFLFKGTTASRQIKASLSGSKTVSAREKPEEIPSVPASEETPASSHISSSPGNSKPGTKTAPLAATPDKSKSNPASTTAGDVGNSGGNFPALKLQGIFYRSLNPSVVINSKTVFVGDRVEHAKVTAIERDSATVEWNGETRVLTLE